MKRVLLSPTDETLLLLCALCLPWSAARAQVVNDGATNTLNNATNNLGVSNVVIGTSGSFTGYILTNSAWLTNTGTGVIGLNGGANSNYVFLQGTNARWNLTGSLTIGQGGSFNQLVISNGSSVANGTTTIGLNAGGDNNRAFNDAVGSYEARIRPAGERLQKLGGGAPGKELAELTPLDGTLRLPPTP